MVRPYKKQQICVKDLLWIHETLIDCSAQMCVVKYDIFAPQDFTSKY